MTRAAQPEGRGRQRGDHGLTTLEWLLITAALAGLAAVAVVVVQTQVQDTADRISESEALLIAAVQSALVVETDATAAPAGDFDLWVDWERHFTRRCDVISVLYSDAEVEVINNNFNGAIGGTAFDPAMAAAVDEQSPNANKAQVQCEVA